MVSSTRYRQHQIGAHAVHHDLTEGDTILELQHIQFSHHRVTVNYYGVLAVALAEKISVVARATVQHVGASAAIKGVVPIFSVE